MRSELGLSRRILGWITERGWRSCVAAVSHVRQPDDSVGLVYVVDSEVSDHVRSAYAGLLGRGRAADPAVRVAEDERSRAESVVGLASSALGGVAVEIRAGRVEREVVAAADGADLLVAVRDGDLTRLGPRSIGRQLRFVVDHAPCACLLVWPERRAPGLETIPPAPPG